ncbi:MAG TPA: type II toxin-antitoxin system prevent-host-death family antitoxin [bacterium]
MKAVGIAELRAKLSQHIREVRKGLTVTVMHRGQPPARIVPIDAARSPLHVRRATRALSEVKFRLIRHGMKLRS